MGLAIIADLHPVELLPGSFFSLRVAAIFGITARLGTVSGIVAHRPSTALLAIDAVFWPLRR